MDLKGRFSGTPEQERPDRPRSGLDFQIHEIRDYLVIILEALLVVNYRSGLTKISSGVPELYLRIVIT